MTIRIVPAETEIEDSKECYECLVRTMGYHDNFNTPGDLAICRPNWMAA